VLKFWSVLYRTMPAIGQQSGLQQSGITVKDVDAHEFVKRYATHLKKQGKIQLPELVDLMKTSVSRELAPYDEDWFYIRCASLARRLYVRQGTGVGAFSKVYGAKKRRGTLPGHFCRSSRGVIRNCLKQLMKVCAINASASFVGLCSYARGWWEERLTSSWDGERWIGGQGRGAGEL
jgi:small subunit ribosomal protein S19e